MVEYSLLETQPKNVIELKGSAGNMPSREEIAIMELELISHHFHMGLSHFLKNF